MVNIQGKETPLRKEREGDVSFSSTFEEEITKVILTQH